MRLERNAGLLALAGVICFAAAPADAAPAPARFALTIVGTAHQEWDYTAPPQTAGGCERIVRSEGVRDVRFKTAAPIVVRVADGRLLASVVRNLAGTATLVGANTISEMCGTERTEAIQDCVRTRRSFRGASVALHGTRRGSITVSSSRAALPAVLCPREPPDVRRGPLGPVPGPLRAPALGKERTTRITLTATATRRTTYGPLDRGTLVQRSEWRLTLVRLPT